MRTIDLVQEFILNLLGFVEGILMESKSFFAQISASQFIFDVKLGETFEKLGVLRSLKFTKFLKQIVFKTIVY